MKTKQIAISALFCALTCVLSIITVPIGPVSVTLSVLAVFLLGFILPFKLSMPAISVYIILGALGLPVFSGMQGGVGVLFGATGGYIISYILMVPAIALIRTAMKGRALIAAVIGTVASLAICYFLGTVWFVHVTSATFSHALSVCVYPFIPIDICKAAAAYLVASRLRKIGFNKIISD